MIQAVMFKKQVRSFRPGTIVHLDEGVNLLVGDQGCGKSTLIDLIRSYNVRDDRDRTKNWRSISFGKKEASEAIGVFASAPMVFIARDFERDSGRYSSDLAEDLSFQLFEMRHSHGEASMAYLDMLDRTISSGGKTLVLLDEPDANLSPRSCYELVRIFRKIAKMGGQVVAAVHNPIAIMGTIPGDPTPGWKSVIDVEDDCRPKSPGDYLESQATQKKEGRPNAEGTEGRKERKPVRKER